MPKRGHLDEWAPIHCSQVAARTSNPIRKIVDQLKDSKSTLPRIPLSIGDPTLDGNLLPPENALKAVQDIVASNAANGYAPSIGFDKPRSAVAEYHKTNFCRENPNADFTAADVILASGGSQALEMAIGALCDAGTNILLPEPCFSLYNTIAENRGILTKFYRCLPDKNWAADLTHMRSLINTRTRAILINNPSNPCGSNFSRQHVADILALAEEFHLPVIADEIYAGMVFGDEVFTSVANVDCKTPRIVVGGTAKNFVVPGWRMGWAIFVDPLKVMKDVFAGMVALSTLIVGPNTVVQAALHSFLLETPPEYNQNLRSVLEKNANIVYDVVSSIPGLSTAKPQAAMYMMVQIDFKIYPEFKDDVEFAKALMEEKNVVVLPGQVFRAPGFVRIVTAKGIEKLTEAFSRIKDFCEDHRKKD